MDIAEPTHMRPDYIDTSIVVRTDPVYVCPWCHASDPTAEEQWVETPLRPRERPWICGGCSYEVYEGCATTNFDDADDWDVENITKIATAEGWDVNAFRRACIVHQLMLIDEMSSDEARLYRHVRARLQELLGAS